MQTNLYRVGIAAILLYITGLVVAGIYFVVRTPEPQPTPQITPICDGEWHINVDAWLDMNRNGVRDNEEQPLSNVAFYFGTSHVNRAYASGPYVSDANGQAEVNHRGNAFMPASFDKLRMLHTKRNTQHTANHIAILSSLHLFISSNFGV